MRAAAALMYERGVARTSTEDVCAAAGVSSSQLYHYFADKRALTHAVIEHQTAVVLGMQEPMLARLDSLDAVRAAAAAKKGAKPPPAKPVAAAAQPTKTIADYKADVDNATDADTATLALDEARAAEAEDEVPIGALVVLAAAGIHALMPWLSVLENVEFGLRMRGMAKAERRAIAMKLSP